MSCKFFSLELNKKTTQEVEVKKLRIKNLISQIKSQIDREIGDDKVEAENSRFNETCVKCEGETMTFKN